MDTRMQLHSLVDRLPADQVAKAVIYLRELVGEDGLRQGGSVEGTPWPVRPSVMSGQDFFTARRLDLADLAARQGVQPVTHFADLLGDFWPEDETAEESIAAVRGWRREGGCGA